MTTEAPVKTTTFISKGRNFRIIRANKSRVMAPNGEWETREGIDYDFAPDGKYVTSDPDVIEYLRQHRRMNKSFWEMGNEPGRPQPSDDEVYAAIAKATADGDAQALEDIWAREDSTHKRSALLASAEAALKTLEDRPQKKG